MRNIIKKKKCLLFKHEKNNQTLSNDWPTYCHTGIFEIFEQVIRCNLVWDSLRLINLIKRKLFQYKYNLFRYFKYFLQFNFSNKIWWFLDFIYDYCMNLSLANEYVDDVTIPTQATVSLKVVSRKRRRKCTLKS